MPNFILLAACAVLLWALNAQWLKRSGIVGPAALVALGSVMVLLDVDSFSTLLSLDAVQKSVEIILAVILFVDATEVRGGIFGGVGRAVSRLVLIALPLSLLMAVLFGLGLKPDADLFVLIVVACIVMPTDFATSTEILRSSALPARTRRILNVESGYNDGLVSPIFIMALALAKLSLSLGSQIPDPESLSGASLASVERHLDEFAAAFVNAVPATLGAILVGVLVGGISGYSVRKLSETREMSAPGTRYVMLLIPLICYGIATLPWLEANGFVAAFVAGLMYRLTRTWRTPKLAIGHGERSLVEDTAELAGLFVWFALGGVATFVTLKIGGVDWRALYFALAALTVARIVPVLISLLGTRFRWKERLLLGVVGPRGTATIVFGLLAYHALEGDQAFTVLTITVYTVILSIVLHGVLTPYVLTRMSRRRPDAAPSP
ncbi:cation:proton antiporter [Arthrobacter sp. RCC_34]|uniref:cation:proton antiporter domain-containing protein n=1 Tax=Arthrobacter sp. RCC_34 TaxID=3239230 RepID=UPI0035235D96